MSAAVLWPGAAEPSSEDARRLLEAELRKLVYHQESIPERVVRWITERIEQLLRGPDPGTSSPLSPWVTALVAVLVVALLAWVLPKVQRERQARMPRGGVLADLTLTAGQLRERANEALRGGDFAAAALDAFRAIARDTADRTLLADAPGLTAHEIGVALAHRFPGHAGDLHRAAALFDAVRYGGLQPGRHEASFVLDLDAALRRARPVLTGPGDHASDQASDQASDHPSDHAAAGVGAGAP